MKICADVGGSFIDIAVVADGSCVRYRHRYPTPTEDWAAFVKVFDDAQIAYRHELDAGAPIAIAIAGLIAPDTGVVTSANIACINGRYLARDLTDVLDRPIAIINDADAFVLAESVLGVARGHRRVFGIILGTGVGGGIIEDGRIVTGPGGIGGEWGHGPVITRSPIAPDANPVFPCGCGRTGCLDTIGSARGLERLHRFLHGIAKTSNAITAAAADADRSAMATLDYYCDLLAGPVAMALNAFPATIVPVGGGLANAGPLIDMLDLRVRAGMLVSPPYPLLVPTILAGDSGLLGASLAADMR